MKRLVCGIAAAAALCSAVAVALANEDTFAGYYENTVAVLGDNFERRSWYNRNGMVQHFNARWRNGQVELVAGEQKWELHDGYVPRAIPLDKDGKHGVALMLHNHFPGQTWRQLIPTGENQDQREICVIFPGHQ